MRSEAAIAELVAGAQARGVFPGAVWAVGDADGVVASGEAGVLDPAEPDEAMGPDVLFDIASLTKITAVWALTGSLVERGALSLDDAVADHLPEAGGHPVGALTVHQLLTHTAGLPLRSNLKNLYGTDPDEIRLGVLREALNREPGTSVDYTDRAALILGYVAERIAAMPLDRAATELIWRPSGMKETRYGPIPDELVLRCAPTEFDEAAGTHLRGVVHDFSARLLGGVCGVSGVFSTIGDLGTFVQNMLVPTAWVEESLRVRTGDLKPARGLFWHTAFGTDAEQDQWAHYGFTGTALWVSPSRRRWAALLTNKVYFTRDRGPMAAVRDAFRTAAFA